jgi:tRNA modification GTPase
VTDTIFALSSGALPAAIGVIRVSGPQARATLERLAGYLPLPRRATLVTLRDPAGDTPLDRGLALWFPGPGSATGEDLAELHIHGGRAVASAMLAALGRETGLRTAEPGEFTRRAFANGAIDLAEAEGLADLLAAETESQRLNAQRWQERLLGIAAALEAALDFDDEMDAEFESAPVLAEMAAIGAAIDALLAAPSADRLRDGVRVVIAGPPNAGKSTLLNALVGRDAAIVAAEAGTTRDLIEVPVAIGGVPLVLIDSAGLRDGESPIERIGIERARAALESADVVLWLGEAPCPIPERAIIVRPRADMKVASAGDAEVLAVSARTGFGMDALIAALLARCAALLPLESELSVNRRQRAALTDARMAIACDERDPLLIAEGLRAALAALDQVTGKAGVEHMLDALFSRFCIGK